jgi:uncharacterized membrane protein YesL
MSRFFSYEGLSSVFGTVYLGLMTNALLLVASLPLVALLMITDPAASWPFIAIAAPLAAPGVSAAFTVFRDHANGGTEVIGSFLRGWRSTWRRAMVIGALASAIVVVLLVDVQLLGSGDIGVIAVPALALFTVLAVAVALLGLVAIAEVPHARLGEVLRAAAYLGLRRWYLCAVSLIALAVQFALFANMPAIALGVTAAPALYLAWANSRFTLRPVLDIDEVATR